MALFMLAFSLTCRVQIGIRLVLPLVAFLEIGIAVAAARAWLATNENDNALRLSRRIPRLAGYVSELLEVLAHRSFSGFGYEQHRALSYFAQVHEA